YKQGIENGVKGLRIISSDELRRLEPNITDDAICALFAPSGAIVCPYELCIAAIGNAMDNGTDLKLNFEVLDIKYESGCYEIISEYETIRSKYVINAAGIYSDSIAGFIGDKSFNIHPRRGEYILLDKECGEILTHTIFRTPTIMGKGILVTPTVDGNLLAGPTSVDMDDKENNETTSEGFSKIIEEASENLKNISFSKTITSFCGLRAVGETNDFIINSPEDGFINVAGIDSPGLSASPAIAEYIIEILNKQGLELNENKSFNPIRKPSHYFREAILEEKNRMIKENPVYGKIICRCETVSEGEIIEAIHKNPGASDIDGIKRRTRSGMGRCQGGFCLPHVVEILARELDVPYERITKSGKGSKVVCGRTKGKK
ncbi:MAG: NAD(P)/FAD-dependent oxidoreductase, partial [Clostridiaceae bacterium]|nr:NAD(P)/FAD-dependent oxidoreductase [Clostridiaceae bacterium]